MFPRTKRVHRNAALLRRPSSISSFTACPANVQSQPQNPKENRAEAFGAVTVLPDKHIPPTTTFAPHFSPRKICQHWLQGKEGRWKRSHSIRPDDFIGWSHLCTNDRRCIRLKGFCLKIPEIQSACLSGNLLEGEPHRSSHGSEPRTSQFW